MSAKNLKLSKRSEVFILEKFIDSIEKSTITNVSILSQRTT